VFDGFFHNKGKVRAFSAITIKVLSIVTLLFNGIVEHFFGPIDLHANFRQESQLHGRAVLVD
jgi:hypothetical protein